jgi:cytoskeletal protein RodZ
MPNKIIWTVLPNGSGAQGDEDYYHFSVVPSIRLEATDNRKTQLSNFSDLFQNWTSKMLDNETTFSLFAGRGIGALKPELIRDKLNPDLWSRFFPSDLLVEPFEIDGLDKERRVYSYPARFLKDTVLTTYRELAARQPQERPFAWRWVPTLLELSDYREMLGEFDTGLRRRMDSDEKELNHELVRKELFGPNRDRLVESRSHKFERDTAPVEKLRSVLQERGFVPFPSEDEQARYHMAQLKEFHKVQKEENESSRESFQERRRQLEPEFHKMLTILMEYPALRRALGLILDFRLPKSQLTADSFLSFKATFGGSTRGDVPEQISMRSLYTLSPVFRLKTQDEGLQKNGWLKVGDDKLFTLLPFETDAAAIKLKNKTDIIAQSLLVGRSVGISESLPTLRSTGITMAVNGLSEHLHNRLNTQQSRDAEIQVSATEPTNLYMEDVTAGYRIDIAVENTDPDKWYSLHEREGTYYANGNAQTVKEEIFSETDEGVLQLGVSKTKPSENRRNYFTQEGQFIWNGWSLSVTRPGRHVEDPEMNKPIEEPEQSFETEFEVPRGTLPRLRYGQSYRLRIRTVDLAGNSWAHTTTLNDPEVYRTFQYLRWEPVMSPLPYFVPKNKQIEVQDGESENILAIRQGITFQVDDDQSIAIPFVKQSARLLIPPEVDHQIYEKHGLLDIGMGKDSKNISTVYNFLAKHDHVMPEPGKERRGKGNPPNKNQQDLRTEAVQDLPLRQNRDGSLSCRYLPDPLAEGIAIWAGRPKKLIGKCAFPRESDRWKLPKPIVFRLLSTPGRQFNLEVNENKGLITFYLPKGMMQLIHVSCYLPLQFQGKNTLDLMGWWPELKYAVHNPPPEENENQRNQYERWRQYILERADRQKLLASTPAVMPPPPTLKELGALIYNGGQYLFTPYQAFRLVHAVPEPLQKPNITTLRPYREPDDITAQLEGLVKVDGKSTNRMDLEAKWEEWIDDTTSYTEETPGGQLTGVKKETRREIAQSINLDYMDGVLQYQEGQETLLHQFNDTKHRIVHYHLTGSTRYREFYASSLIDNDSREAQKLPSVTGNQVQVSIPSSARPLAPEIEYIIPLMEWKEEKGTNFTQRIRSGGAFRVFLKRPWFSSGQGEMLGVVCRSKKDLRKYTNKDVLWSDEEEPNKPLHHLLTQWGHDPISLPVSGGPMFPTQDFFKNHHSVHEDIYVKEAIVTNWQEGQTPPIPTPLDIVAYEVHFDQKRNLWYTDIHLTAPITSYFPFIKFAFVRYQPNSLAHITINEKQLKQFDYHISRIVQPDFVQILPEKRLVLEFSNPDLKNRFSVNLVGPVARELRQVNEDNIPFSINMVEMDIEKRLPDGSFVLDNNAKRARYYNPTSEVKGTLGTFREEVVLDNIYQQGGFRFVIKEWEWRRADEGIQMGKYKRGMRLVYADKILVE